MTSVVIVVSIFTTIFVTEAIDTETVGTSASSGCASTSRRRRAPATRSSVIRVTGAGSARLMHTPMHTRQIVARLGCL